MGMVRAIFIACLLSLCANAWAAYPERPIKVFLPFPPGGTVDVVSRLVCAEMSEILGKAVVIDYRPGAGGTLATEATARAPADGYTLLYTQRHHPINTPFQT